MTDAWQEHMTALGSFIRSQRQLANLSLRQLAELTTLSNPYLSQLERGLHQPSVRVLKLVADALQVSTEDLLARSGLSTQDENAAGGTSVEAAIQAEERLSAEQKAALIAVYRSMLGS